MRFLESFFLGCLNAIFKNFSNLSSSLDWLFSIKSMADLTLGEGVNASGSTSKQSVASPTELARTERAENSFCLTFAENLTATSF